MVVLKDVKLDGVEAVVQRPQQVEEVAPDLHAKWRQRYIIKQLDSLEGNMDAVYRALCSQLIEAEHESIKVSTILRRNVNKEGEVAAKLQEEATGGYRLLTVQWLQPLLTLGNAAAGFYLPANQFQALSGASQFLQSPLQTFAEMERQGLQARQNKRGAEKNSADQLSQQLVGETSRLKDLQEGLRRNEKDKRDAETQLFSQIARG